MQDPIAGQDELVSHDGAMETCCCCVFFVQPFIVQMFSSLVVNY